MTQTLWIVTGISRLTGQREQCSMAAPKAYAEKLLESGKRSRTKQKAYTHLKLEPFEPDIFNK